MSKRMIAVILMSLGLSLAAWPQVQGKLTGVVVDAMGKPVEKAEVTVVSTKTVSMNFDLATNKEGKFFQVGVMPGYYQITVKKPGYVTRVTEVRVSLASEMSVAIKLDAADEVVQKSLSAADKLFIAGNKLYAEQKYPEAASSYEEALKLNGSNWGYYFNLGLAYKKMSRPAEEAAAFVKAVELNPTSYSANKELGEALAKGGDFEKAKTYYRKAVALSPDDPDAQYNLGICLVNTGEAEEALACFRKTADLKPDYAEAFYQIGTILIGRNEAPEAIESLEKFLALAPGHEKAPLARQLLEFLKK
ncbi:MAG: tetratricopeptide repeat protein [Candidatus Aminicenantales bacterium]